MSNKDEMTASERYRSQAQNQTVEIVDVVAPSGFVFKFEKPSKFTMLFRYGKLPQVAANGAVQEWIDQGLMKPGDIETDQARQIAEGIKLRDRVLLLSHDPKLVVGEALNANELSTDDVSDDDIAYLFQWVTAGGDKSIMLGTFPERPEPNAVVGNGGPKRGSKAQ